MTSARTVHIVSDNATLRRSLEKLLHSAAYEAVAYPSQSALLDAAPNIKGGCILIEVGALAEFLARLRGIGIRIPVIVLASSSDIGAAVSAMKQGAFDFIERPFEDKILVTAIDAALGSASTGMPDQAAIEAARRLATLSQRERQVLDALVRGLTNKLIAVELGLSVRTVEVHRAHMLHRLGVHRTAVAIGLAIQAGLLTGL
jgi:two-component system, LuxR family, response regulator FixJ